MTDADLKAHIVRLAGLCLEVRALGVMGLSFVGGELSHVIGYLAPEKRTHIVEVRGDLNIAALLLRAGMFDPPAALEGVSAMLGETAKLIPEG